MICLIFEGTILTRSLGSHLDPKSEKAEAGSQPGNFERGPVKD